MSIAFQVGFWLIVVWIVWSAVSCRRLRRIGAAQEVVQRRRKLTRVASSAVLAWFLLCWAVFGFDNNVDGVTMGVRRGFAALLSVGVIVLTMRAERS